jgi:hypothetical protein
MAGLMLKKVKQPGSVKQILSPLNLSWLDQVLPIIRYADWRRKLLIYDAALPRLACISQPNHECGLLG